MLRREKEETVTSLEKDPTWSAPPKNVEQCHYNYVHAVHPPARRRSCEENFEKTCQITSSSRPQRDREEVLQALRRCATGRVPRSAGRLRELLLLSSTARSSLGKFVGDTSCEKLPVEIRSRCTTRQRSATNDKTIAFRWWMYPRKARVQPRRPAEGLTKLVPKLKPEHQCTVPRGDLHPQVSPSPSRCPSLC